MTRAPLTHRLRLVSTDEPGKAGVNLVFFLLAADRHLLGVDDDDEVPRVHMRRENRLMFAPEQDGGPGGHAAEGLLLGIDEPPFTFDFGGFGGKGLHERSREANTRAAT